MKQETFRRYQAFGETFTRFKSDKKAAQTALRRTFGRTFWYYTLFASARQMRENPLKTEIGGKR